MKPASSAVSIADSAGSCEDGVSPLQRPVPWERPDLAAQYDAAMCNLAGLHTQILQALRLPVLDPERWAAERWAAEKDFPAEPRGGDVKSKVHQAPDAVKSPLGTASSCDEQLQKAFGEKVVSAQLKELTAHYGVALQPLQLHREAKEDTKLVPQDWVSRLVRHGLFDFCASAMIFANSFVIAVETQWLATHTEAPMTLEVLNHCFSGFFLLELLLRIMAQRWDFCCESRGRGWNIFDTCLVIISIVDTAASAMTPDPGAQVEAGDGRDQTMDVLQAVRILKMLRIARIFRVFRFSRELSLMALMIIDSLRSLMWALLMLLLMIFVFAVWFTTNATFYLKPNADLSRDDWFEQLQSSSIDNVVNIQANFGTLQATTYSLLRSMLGGINWGILCDMLLAMDTLSPMLFIFYVLFALLAVLNIVTGVFVDNAVDKAKTQREFLIEKEREVKEKYIKELQNLFLEMDVDASGTLTAEEMQHLVKDPKMSAYFSALGFEAHDCVRLFSLLDSDASGHVDIEEFLDGCLRLKGMARSIDVHFIMVLIHRLQKQLSGFETGHNAVLARLARQRSREMSSRLLGH
ncbi:Scn11a [Symbiodinium sp. CCMP2592]|nr:Scn11a [Symbiodinium sp. CCMP2592]